MTPDEHSAFIVNTCHAASEAGVTLRLDETPEGFEWQWSNVPFAEKTDAKTKAVALFLACQGYYQTVSI